jgi:hypothetical protein
MPECEMPIHFHMGSHSSYLQVILNLQHTKELFSCKHRLAFTQPQPGSIQMMDNRRSFNFAISKLPGFLIFANIRRAAAALRF